MPARSLPLSLRFRCLLRKPHTSRAFSTRGSLRAADHGNHYDPPGGWLFGVKPGQKYVKEGWENIFYFGFIGSLVAAGIAYVFKPDTSYVQSSPRSAFSRNTFPRSSHGYHTRFPQSHHPLQDLRSWLLIHFGNLGYKPGPWKRHAGDWKQRAYWKTPTNPRSSDCIESLR